MFVVANIVMDDEVYFQVENHISVYTEVKKKCRVKCLLLKVMSGA